MADPAPDPLESEYSQARRHAAFFELKDRVLLTVTGPTRLKFLHSILSNEIASLAAGEGCRAALMDVKGHQLAWMRVLVASDAVLLEVPGDRIDTVEAQLTHYRVAAPVRFARPAIAVLGLLGPAGPNVLQQMFGQTIDLPPEGHAVVTSGDTEVRVVRAGDLPAAGYVLLLEPARKDGLMDALRQAGASEIGVATLDALRIEDGRPWYGVDVTEAHLLHETGLVREYHSPTKGCYVGQEVIARLDARGGHVNKALRGLRLQAAARAGDAITSDGREVGLVTTAALSPRWGPVAMGYLHRSSFEPGSAVSVNGQPAQVVALPMKEPQP